jgi:hypothetical protein
MLVKWPVCWSVVVPSVVLSVECICTTDGTMTLRHAGHLTNIKLCIVLVISTTSDIARYNIKLNSYDGVHWRAV